VFHSAAVKLTVWYLAIIMSLSLIFSFSLYKVSSEDLGRNVNRQIGYFNNLLAPDQVGDYRELRSAQLDQDINHLKGNLVLFNLMVLVGGGAASYWLARRTLEPIEEALEGQTRFASDASHELRTPLTAMMTENEVALRSKSLTKTDAVKVIKSNLEEAAKLKSLAEGLLRLSSGAVSQSPEPVKLKSVCSEAIDRYAKAAQQKKITLINQVGDLTVIGDKDGLVELLSIFLDNAIKYIPAGSSIKISAARRSKNVVVQIIDTGNGIKQTDLPHIFDRFYRADSSRTKESEGGYGLGLAIAKKIAEAHRGHIEVSSAVGKGTTFSVFLPAA
jgi:two-component system sensor histidine kinase CiaH